MALFLASLAIGGTGMLAQATTWLAERSAKTIVVARRATSFHAPNGDKIPVDADWSDPSFAYRVGASLEPVGAIQMALLWLHEPNSVLPWLLPMVPTARVVLLLGSMDGQPRIPELAERISTVRLGSMLTPQGRRWLTDDEICAGAIASMRDGGSRVIGELASAR